MPVAGNTVRCTGQTDDAYRVAVADRRMQARAAHDVDVQLIRILGEAARDHGTAVVRALLDRGIWDKGDYRIFYNVNFPPIAGDKVRGMKVSAQGYRTDTFFGVEPHVSPSGRKFLWITGGPQHHPTAPGTDVAVNLDGWISVTPMRADLTAHDVLDDLAGRLG